MERNFLYCSTYRDEADFEQKPPFVLDEVAPHQRLVLRPETRVPLRARLESFRRAEARDVPVGMRISICEYTRIHV